MSNKFPESKQKRYTLFIHPRSNGSKKCMNLLQQSTAQDLVQVINITNIPANRKPPFIDGAPILVDHVEQDLCRGKQCVSFVRYLCKDNKIFNAPANPSACLITSLTSFDGERRLQTGYQSLDLSQTLGEESYESRALKKNQKITESSVQAYQKLRNRMDEKLSSRHKHSKLHIGE